MKKILMLIAVCTFVLALPTHVMAADNGHLSVSFEQTSGADQMAPDIKIASTTGPLTVIADVDSNATGVHWYQDGVLKLDQPASAFVVAPDTPAGAKSTFMDLPAGLAKGTYTIKVEAYNDVGTASTTVKVIVEDPTTSPKGLRIKVKVVNSGGE